VVLRTVIAITQVAMAIVIIMIDNHIRKLFYTSSCFYFVFLLLVYIVMMIMFIQKPETINS
jgi:hypothetical protein